MRNRTARKGKRMKTKSRKKGAGTLVLRGRVFEARWTVNGKKFSRSTGATTRREAEAKLAEFVAPFQAKEEAETLAALSERIKGAEERAGDALLLAEAWNAYEGSMKRGAVAEVTLTRYRQRFGIFAAWMCEHFPAVLEVRGVTEEHAEAFMREIAASKSGKTFNDYRAILLQVWNVLAHDKRAKLAGNPWEGISRRDKATFTRRELTVEELASVIASVDGEMRVLFAVGIYTGLRLGDAVALDWGAVDLVRGFIDATPHKTARHGTRVHIPIASVLRGILEETPKSKRRGPVMPELLAMYRHSDVALSERIQRVFRRCGIETQAEVAGAGRKRVAVGYHSLRHTFVSLCANGGVPLAVVQSIVGHTNAAMTRHYFHVSDDALRGASAALPDVVTVDAEAVEVEDAPKGAAESRARALPGAKAILALPAPSGVSGGNLEALAAILARMDGVELAEAARMVNEAMSNGARKE